MQGFCDKCLMEPDDFYLVTIEVFDDGFAGWNFGVLGFFYTDTTDNTVDGYVVIMVSLVDGFYLADMPIP